MERFYWHNPCSPYIISQGWGIENPIYQQFGFTRHNGVDFCTGLVEYPLYVPFPSKLVNKATQSGGGNFITIQSLDKFKFDDGIEAYVMVDMLHLKTLPVIEVGTKLNTGDFLATGDNTGLSTGPHTHAQFRRTYTEYPNWTPIDKNGANNSFDPEPYRSGKFAPDIKKIVVNIGLLNSLISALIAKLFPKK